MSTLFTQNNQLNNGFQIPRSELFLDGDLFSLGDFFMSGSVSLEDLDTFGGADFDGTLVGTDWPSFKLVWTFLDDMPAAGDTTTVLEQNLKSANDEGM